MDYKQSLVDDLDSVLEADYSGVWQRAYRACPDCGSNEDASACATCQSTGVIESFKHDPHDVPVELRKMITGYTMIGGQLIPKMRDKDKAATLRAQVTTGIVQGTMNVKLDYADMDDAELEAKLAILRKAQE